jgi:preprotein translocase subunit SecA
MLNPLTFLSKFIKSSNQKELDRLGKIVTKINTYEESMVNLSDSDFPTKTSEFK